MEICSLIYCSLTFTKAVWIYDTFENTFDINPFTLRVSLGSIVCSFVTFVNNSGIKQKLSKYLKESCRLTSG